MFQLKFVLFAFLFYSQGRVIGDIRSIRSTRINLMMEHALTTEENHDNSNSTC